VQVWNAQTLIYVLYMEQCLGVFPFLCQKIMAKTITIAGQELKVEYVPLSSLRPAEYNPRKWSKEATEQLTESIKRFGIVDPLLVNCNPNRKGIVIGGNFRMSIFKKLGIKECPTVQINIPDIEKEKELCVRHCAQQVCLDGIVPL
jgi:hypothetical protein